MSLVDRHGAPVADGWTDLVEGETAAGDVIVLLARLIAEPALAVPGRLGVRLPSDTRIEAVVPLLPRLALVVIEFPKFRDGRGFTLARALREHHAYAGEIRAVGHVLPDQFQFLVQTGFSTVRVPEGQPIERWAEALVAPPAQLLGRLTAKHPAAG